eukprot:scaffold15301_cov142-Cylindrotheca_fusiformis.AAC.4
MSSLRNQMSFIFDPPSFQGKRYCAILPRPFPENSFDTESANLDANKEKEDLDRYLAASMGKLSLKDREAALEEVHGILKNDPEDTCFLQANLQAMEDRLNSIKRGTVYEKAEAVDPCFVSSREIRLLFLRGNRYDPKAAAEQLIKHFDLKLSLFGSKKLTKDITLVDLDDNDRICLASGFCQILPQKDVAGRTILLILPGLHPNLDAKNGLRAMYYLAMKTLQESEEIQKKGIVKLAYAVGRYKTKTVADAQVAQYVSSTPFPVGGMHLCFDASDYLEYVYCRAIILVLSTSVAAKTRIHFGTHMECLYALRGYGITEGSLPISPIDVHRLLHNHRTWYEHRKKLDLDLDPVKPNAVSSQQSEIGDFANAMVCPILTPKIEPRWGDVLVSHLVDALLTFARTRLIFCKFGREHQVHPGNLRLKKLLLELSVEYEAIVGKKEKMEFAHNLVRQMKASGSRFLMFDRSIEAWAEVCDKVARNKVSKTLRNNRRLNSIF